MATIYTVTVKTHDDDGSGTNGNIFITLYGSYGKITEERQLDSDQDDFEAGDETAYSLAGSMVDDVGLPEAIQLRKEGGEDWQVAWVIIKYEKDERPATFPVYAWLKGDQKTLKIQRDSPPIVHENAVLTETSTEIIVHKRHGVTDNRLGLLPLEEEKSAELSVTSNLTYTNAKREGSSQSYKGGAKLEIKKILELSGEASKEMHEEVENTYGVSRDVAQTATHTVRMSVPPGALTLYEITYEQTRYRGTIKYGEDELEYSYDGPPRFNTVTQKWDVLPGEAISPQVKAKLEEFKVTYHKRNYFAYVRTTGGDHLHLRSAPGTNQKILYKLNSGDQVIILNDDPKYAEGLLWWNVSVEVNGDLITGWCVEAFKENNDMYLCLLPTGFYDIPRA